jgi:hypothetical protein
MPWRASVAATAAAGSGSAAKGIVPARDAATIAAASRMRREFMVGASLA